jgi:hypothetical protein
MKNERTAFLRNHLPDIAAIDMFVVATATFRLLYALIVPAHAPAGTPQGSASSG